MRYSMCFVVINATTGDVIRRYGENEYGFRYEMLARQDAIERNTRAASMKLTSRYVVQPELDCMSTTIKG